MAELQKELNRLRSRVKELESGNRALRDSEDRLAALVEHMPAVAFVRDLEGRFALVNSAYEETYAVTNEHVCGKPLADVLPKAAARQYLAHDRRVIAGKEVVEEEIGITLDGRPHVFSSIKFPIRDADGEMIAVGGIEQDITNRKAAERELQEARDAMAQAQARLFDAVESMSDAIVVYDSDGRLEFCNNRFKAFYGYSDDEAREGVTWDDLVRIDIERGLIAGGRQGAESYYGRRAAVRDDLTSSSEVELSDGRWLHVRDRRTSTGGIVSIQADITERKRAEAALQQGEARLDLALQATGACVWDYDLRNGEAWWSRELYRMLGYAPEELAPTYDNWKALLHPEDLDRVVGAEGDELEDWAAGQGARSEYRLKRKDGAFIWVEDMATATFDDAGKVQRQTGVMRDITARREAEERLRSNEQQLRNILEGSPIAVAISVDDQTQDDGIIQFANGRFVDMLGFDPDDVGKARTEQFLPKGEDRDEHERKLDEGLSLIDMEIQVNRQDGSNLWALMSISPIQFNDRQSALIWLYDITQRKQAEELIETQRALFSDILENVPQGMALFDKDKKLLAWNSKYPRTLDVDPAMLSTDTTIDELALHAAQRGYLGDGDVEAQVAARVEKLYSENTRTELSFDGKQIFDAQGIVTTDGRVVVSYTDITERLEAEKKLQNAYGTISESINYASNIQRSVLTEEQVLAEATREHLLLWEPRDVVGGDICWCHTWGDGTLVTLADCTGHGVPGAFMTLIATGALDRAMNEVPPGNVGYLIQRMHQIVQTTLSQESEGGGSDDGLELGACYIRPDWGKLTFAGARLPLFVVENGDVAEVKATRQGIGYRGIPRRQAYEDTKIDLRDGMTFYMTSDGFLDQVGGPQRRMFGKKRFKELLLSLDGRSLAEQKEALHGALLSYQGKENRRDDVSMVAFRV